MSDGWNESADAWIAQMDANGDFGRRFVVDRPMLERAADGRFQAALDVGCGEGRFCRMLQAKGVRAVGVDPTVQFIEHARKLDPDGDYRVGSADALDFADGSFDLAVSYMVLIDIADIETAVAEMVRVLRPGGSLLIANLSSLLTASFGPEWTEHGAPGVDYPIRKYFEERGEWHEFIGARILNWHRPLSRYMSVLLEKGLILRWFSEPTPYGGDTETAERYRQVPYYVLMEWQKPA
jgi:ubiquinone/menaquinone biosynthesis C-methylase UbiE